MLFLDICVEALQVTWHIDHFKCSRCDTPFGDSEFILHDNKPYCLHDFGTLFGQKVNNIFYILFLISFSVEDVGNLYWILLWKLVKASFIRGVWGVKSVKRRI